MDGLGTLITAFIVAGVLDILTARSQKVANSTEKFIVRAPLYMAGIGTIGMVVCLGILIGASVEEEHLPVFIIVLLMIVGVLPSLFLMVVPIKGIWDVIVDGDDITVVKAFIYKRHWKFSDITYGKLTRGGMKIYVEGRERKAFFVDGMCNGFLTFLQRMADEEKETDCPGGVKEYVKEMKETYEAMGEDIQEK